MPAATLKSRMEEWKEKNPLRQWRTDTGLTLHDASSLLTCGVSTIQVFEAGSREPNDEYIERMAKVMHVKGDVLRKQWSVWLSRRPRP